MKNSCGDKKQDLNESIYKIILLNILICINTMRICPGCPKYQHFNNIHTVVHRHSDTLSTNGHG